MDLTLGGTRISVAGYFNKTKYPYRLNTTYSPFEYRISQVPGGYKMPANPDIVVDNRTGQILVGDKDDPSAGYTPMDTKVMDKTFVKNIYSGQQFAGRPERFGGDGRFPADSVDPDTVPFRCRLYEREVRQRRVFLHLQGEPVAFVNSGSFVRVRGDYCRQRRFDDRHLQRPADEASGCREPDRHYAHSVDPDGGHLVAPGGVVGFALAEHLVLSR